MKQLAFASGQFKAERPEPLGQTINLRLPKSADSIFQSIPQENTAFYARYLMVRGMLQEGWAKPDELETLPFKVLGPNGELDYQLAVSAQDAVRRAQCGRPEVEWGQALPDWPHTTPESEIFQSYAARIQLLLKASSSQKTEMLENLFYDVAHDLDLLGEDPETIVFALADHLEDQGMDFEPLNKASNGALFAVAHNL